MLRCSCSCCGVVGVVDVVVAVVVVVAVGNASTVIMCLYMVTHAVLYSC